MGLSPEDIWHRTLPQAHHAALADMYHLKRFLSASKGRRERYFAIVAGGPATLEVVLRREPSEEDLRDWIAFVLGRDRTFYAYVSKHGGRAETLDPQRWGRVLEAGVGAIMGEYLITHATGARP